MEEAGLGRLLEVVVPCGSHELYVSSSKKRKNCLRMIAVGAGMLMFFI